MWILWWSSDSMSDDVSRKSWLCLQVISPSEHRHHSLATHTHVRALTSRERVDLDLIWVFNPLPRFYKDAGDPTDIAKHNVPLCKFFFLLGAHWCPSTKLIHNQQGCLEQTTPFSPRWPIMDKIKTNRMSHGDKCATPCVCGLNPQNMTLSSTATVK